MSKFIKISGVTVATLGILLALYASGLYTKFAKAAVAVFTPSTCYTAAATTSAAFMTPGAGTSTVTCVLGPEGARSAVVAAVVTASSTLAQFRFGVEESMDGIDWYPVRYGLTASTSPTLAIETDGIVTYQFASSTTIGGSGGLQTTGNNRNHFTFEIPVRMQRVRVWTGLGTATTSTNGNGTVWLRIIPRQDTN